MDQVLTRSSGLQDLRLLLIDTLFEEEDSLAREFLLRHSLKLTYLSVGNRLSDTCNPQFRLGAEGQCISQVATALWSRHDCPNLEFLDISNPGQFPQEFVPWLAMMVSAPNGPLIDDLTSQPTILDDPSTNSPSANDPSASKTLLSDMIEPWTPLKLLQFNDFNLQPEEWKVVIEALDLSTLETLNLHNTNFLVDELRILVDRIPRNASKTVALKDLDLRWSLMVHINDPDVQALNLSLKEKLPSLIIKGLEAAE
jgi:hypothetical protein